MKFNKKMIVASLSTIMGLGIVGSITGTVAWYQYSTRATASIIGYSAGKSGYLQIKGHSEAETEWRRDAYTNILKGANTNALLFPCTFGGFAKDAALPGSAYKIGKDTIGSSGTYTGWDAANATNDYIQYTVDLRAMMPKADKSAYEQKAVKVYISDIVLEDTNTSAGDVTSALRMQITCGSFKKVIANTATTLDTTGKLDLDGDGKVDKVGGYEWAEHYNDDCVYGVADSTLTSYTIAEVETANGVGATEIGTTLTDAALQVTVTIWLEGWAQLDPYAAPKDTDVKAMWDPDTMGKTIHAGITFEIAEADIPVINS